MSFKASRTRPLRCKRPALASMGYDSIVTKLDEIYSACQDIPYYMDDAGAVTLLNADDLEKACVCFTSCKERNPRNINIFSRNWRKL